MTLQVEVDTVVLPGDVIATVEDKQTDQLEGAEPSVRDGRPLRLGPGLIQDRLNIVATKAGVLRHKSGRVYWVENHQKHYVAALDDLVLGVITDRDGYFVDIGSSEPAKLDALAFPGATKRNKPDLQAGHTVYARVSLAHRDMAPELTCISHDRQAGGMLGELKGGTLLKLPISLARRLLSGSCVIMSELGKHLSFEVAVGVNGFVWVNASSSVVVIVCNAIINSEYLSPAQCKQMVRLVIERME